MVNTGYKLMDISNSDLTNSDRWKVSAACWDNFIDHVIGLAGEGIYEWSGETVDQYVETMLAEWNGWTVGGGEDDDYVTEFALWFKTESDATQFVLRWA